MLFASFKYHISPSFPSTRIEELRHVLERNGASSCDGEAWLKEVNLVVSNSTKFEGWEDVKERNERKRLEGGDGEEVYVVTDKWVDRSLVLGKIQSPYHYSSDPSLVFSGIIACATSLPPSDLEVLSAGITALGGQWRTGLTKDVTHLFAMSPDSQKYATAMHFREETGVKVILPHWFDDVVRLGMGGLSTEVYEWPDPELLRNPLGVNGSGGGVSGGQESGVKRNMYALAALFTAPMHDSSSPPLKDLEMAVANRMEVDIWQGKKILLGRTLQLFEGRREAVQIGIERAGGVVVRYDGDEEVDEGFAGGHDELSKREKERRKSEAEKVLESDVLVTRWRDGPAYIAALRSHKTIGTLPWLFHVQSTSTLTRPLDQLLHYPVPKRPIEAFSNHIITVTNYTGEAREYLKKLIIAMGAKFTPSMSGQNTVLIAAYISGTKSSKAQSWSIPIVNHTWLEDCFIQWRNLTVGLEKYIGFPNGVDFSKLLGVRGVGAVLEEGLDEEMDGGGGEGEAPLGTDASVQEVQGLIVSGDVDMVDMQVEHVGGEDPVGLKMDVDEEEEDERTPKKTHTRAPTSKRKVNGRDTSPIPTSSRVSPKKATAEPEEMDDEEEEEKTNGKQKRKTKTKNWASSPDGEEEEVEPTRIQKQKKRTTKKRLASSSEAEIQDEDEDEDEDESRVELASSKVAKGKRGKGKQKLEEKVPTHSKESENEGDSEVEAVSSRIAKADLNARGKVGSKKKEVKAPAKKSKDEDEDEDMVMVEEVVSPKTKSKKANSTEKTKSRDEDEEEEDEEENPKSKGPGKVAKAGKKRKSVDSDDDDEDEQDKGSRVKSKPKPKTTPIKYTTPTKPTILSKPTTSAKRSEKPKVPEPASIESEDDSEDELTLTPPPTRARNTKLIRRVSGVVTDVVPAVQDKESSSEKEDGGEKVKPRLSLIEKSQAKKGDARTRVRKRKVEVEVEVETEEEEEEEEEQPVALVKARSLKKAKGKETQKGKEKSRVYVRHSDEDEEEEVDDKPSKTKTSVRKSSKPAKYSKSKPTSISDDDGVENSPSDENNSDSDLPAVPLLASIKNTGDTAATKSKSKSKKPVASTSVSAPAAKSRSTTKSQAKSKLRVTAESEDEDEEDGKAGGIFSTPKRSISVLMPSFDLSGSKKKGGASASAGVMHRNKKIKFSVSSEEDEDQEPEGPRVLISPRSRAITRTDSIRVMSSHQVSAKYPGAGAAVFGSASVVMKKNTNATVSTSKTKSTAMDIDSPPPPSTKNKTSPKTKPQSPVLKRSAATKATQRLHDTIMPDLVHFESQMKRANVKGRKSGGLSAFKVEGENGGGGKRSQTGDADGEEDEERVKKRRRVDDDDVDGSISARGKRKVREEEEEEDGVKKRSTKKSGKGKVAVVAVSDDQYPEDDEDEAVVVSKGTKTKSKGKGKDVETLSKSSVMLLTTQVTLSDEVIRVLTKLGVKMTSRPSECTHLLAPQLVRTEKFLCALVVAPFILTEKWAIQSAAVKKLLPEKGFALHDVSGENKYGVDLTQSLRRAKELGGKLLTGQTFYVTPKVPVDTKLLKNVVTACGGQVTTQQPTARIINASPQNRHVISCKEDIAIWRPIAAMGIPIYSQELLLTGALRQEMEWDSDGLRVDI